MTAPTAFEYPELPPYERPAFVFPVSRDELYNSFGDELVQARYRARLLMHKYNHSLPEPPSVKPEQSDRRKILAELLGVKPESMGDVYIEPPFAVDYGFNIVLEGAFYANFNCCILDCSKITIGDRVLFGPNISLYAATHGLSVVERLTGDERSGEIKIGADCWIGGSVCIQAGVILGQGCTVGAGAVVTKSFPDWSVILGNPARLVKVVPENERGPGWDNRRKDEVPL